MFTQLVAECGPLLERAVAAGLPGSGRTRCRPSRNCRRRRLASMRSSLRGGPVDDPRRTPAARMAASRPCACRRWRRGRSSWRRTRPSSCIRASSDTASTPRVRANGAASAVSVRQAGAESVPGAELVTNPARRSNHARSVDVPAPSIATILSFGQCSPLPTLMSTVSQVSGATLKSNIPLPPGNEVSQVQNPPRPRDPPAACPSDG